MKKSARGIERNKRKKKKGIKLEYIESRRRLIHKGGKERDGLTDKQIDRHIIRWIEREKKKKQTQTDRQIDTHTDRQAGRPTEM